MVEPHPLMALMLANSSFVGQGPEVEDEIRPLPQQLAFTVGDAALMASANTHLERDFAVLRAVDPADHAEEFPDWEERMMGTAGQGWSSHVLCEHFSREDLEITLGWFSRVKLLPIAKYRYKEALGWLKRGRFPDEIPEWAHKYHLKFSDELAKSAPTRVPRRVQCPNCKQRDIDLEVTRTVVYRGHAGQLRIDDADRFITITDPDIDDSHLARLICTNCETPASLTDDEWQLPGISG